MVWPSGGCSLSVPSERETVVSQIFNYADAVESVYMEIGLKCRMALAVQFLSGSKVK